MANTTASDVQVDTQKGLVILRDICPSSESLQLTEAIATPSEGTPHTGVVLASLDGPCMDFRVPTRNDRLYEEELCDEIAMSDYVAELRETKNALGEPDHPMKYEGRMDIHYPNVSHAWRNFRKVPEKGCYYATFDILDTPMGRILKTLIDYGVKLGVSSRGAGRTITKAGAVVVDKSSYRFITFDIVCMPGNMVARLPTNESTEFTDELTESLSEQIQKMVESKDLNSLKSVKPLLNYLYSDATEAPLLETVDNALTDVESDTIADTVSEDLLSAYKKIEELRMQLSDRDSIIASKDDEISLLSSQVAESQDTPPGSDADGLLAQAKEVIKASIAAEDKANRQKEEISEKYKMAVKENLKLSEALGKAETATNNLNRKAVKLETLLNSSSKKNSAKIESLEDELETTSGELRQVNESYGRLASRYDELATKYFSARCSQLGVNEQVAQRSLTESWRSYSSDDLDRVIRKHVSQGSRAKRSANQPSLMESLQSQSGGVRINATYSGTQERPPAQAPDERSSNLSLLTESCRSVRKQDAISQSNFLNGGTTNG